MKNLVTEFKKGTSLKDIQESKEDKHDKWFGSRKSTYHSVDGVTPWRRIKRICEAYKGKQFNKAFSEYCRQVPVYQQKFFLEEFEKKTWRGDYWTYYYVDKQGNIQKHIGEYFVNKAKNKKVYYYSDDYKTEKRYKVSGAPAPKYFSLRASSSKCKLLKEEDFVDTIVSGYYLEFSSAKDPEFIRLKVDQAKRKKAAARIKEKEKAAKAYSFISKSEKQLKEEKAKDRIKIEVKGFDILTSFRDVGTINPDEIARLQGFIK